MSRLEGSIPPVVASKDAVTMADQISMAVASSTVVDSLETRERIPCRSFMLYRWLLME